MLKDSKGFMWFGTTNGLTRYDGVNFVVYENIPNDSSSLTYNNISFIYEDKHKNLWVGTFRGLNLYNREKNNFSRISQFQSNFISAICEDKNENLWIGTVGNRLFKYGLRDKKVENFVSNQTDINAINANHITCILPDNKNRLWVGSWNGLYLIGQDGKTIRHFTNEPTNPSRLSDNYVNALALEKDSALWIGTLYGGLNRLNINDKTYQLQYYLKKSDGVPNSSILSLFADKNHRLWVGTENNGLLNFNTTSNSFNYYVKQDGDPHTLTNNTIRSLYVDDLNILWIGTMGGGVNLLDERYKRFEIYKKNPNLKNTLCGDDVHDMAEDKQGNIWMATFNGISMFDVKSRQFVRTITKEKGGLTTNAVNSLAFDSEENLWVGTLNEGVDRFNKNLVKTGNFKIKGIQKAGENKINLIYIDSKDNVWVGTSGSGLFRFDKSKGSFVQIFNEAQGVGSNEFGYVLTIMETSDNSLWVGTAYRLFCLKDADNHNYTYKIFNSDDRPGSIHSNYIVSLLEDHDKNLWVGSLDHGLFLYDKRRNSFVSYTKEDGLASNTVYGILEDNDSNLWISSNKGISKFNPFNKKITSYTVEDGLVTNEFIGNSFLKSKDGELFFGSNEGVNGFYPATIKDNKTVQPVLLTDFKLFNQSVHIGDKGSPLSQNITETQKIELKYNQSSFTLEFVALNYIHGSKSRYAYILEGLENTWNIIENKNAATYSYLKPGNYIFKVKGSNNDGVWNNTPATLEIVILPPFWKSKLAFVLYILLFITIIYLIIHFNVSRAKHIHLAELNQMKLQFFANISHELRTPLSLIISPVEQLLEITVKNPTVKDQLGMIHKNAKHLVRLVNEMMDFYKAEESNLTISVQPVDIVKITREFSTLFNYEASCRQISYTFEAEPSSIEAWLDWEKYEKIVLNLLSNAFKFTPDNGVVSIKMDKLASGSIPPENNKRKPIISATEWVRINISDNGREISPTDITKIFDRYFQGNHKAYKYQAGTGIGLSLTKLLVELHHGRIFATSQKEKETCFTILLPLGNTHFKTSEISEDPADIQLNSVDYTDITNQRKMKESELPQNAPILLLVEDHVELRNYIHSIFSATYKIIEASNGDIGYSLALENVPDLIISDIVMPGISGIELCKRIKENIITSHIPIVLLTAKTTIEDKIGGVEVGADAYITKPFNIKHLETVIRNLIETRKKLFQRFSQDVYILPKEISSNLLDQEFLEKIIKYVEDNITSAELSVEDLADHLLMSPGHVWRKVKALTGTTTNEFVRNLRLKKAITLMNETNLNISEIAYKVGFSSPAYFAKCFKDQYGKSPSAFVTTKKKGPKNNGQSVPDS